MTMTHGDDETNFKTPLGRPLQPLWHLALWCPRHTCVLAVVEFVQHGHRSRLWCAAAPACRRKPCAPGGVAIVFVTWQMPCCRRGASASVPRCPFGTFFLPLPSPHHPHARAIFSGCLPTCRTTIRDVVGCLRSALVSSAEHDCRD